ncbi:MAG: TonB C-terminal domain-containing protein [Gallionella sp.]|nr:TonB C-terminal domain-containing protein [Gallionella sp.]
MSATLIHEPFRLPAGIMAFSVHAVFLALLYFGFSWQAFPPATMSVELWQSLPEVEVAPPVPVIAEAVQPVQPAQPEKLLKPDISLPDKKEKREIETKPVVTRPDKNKVEAPPVQQNSVEQKRDEAEQRERIAAQQAAQAAREKAEQAAREQTEKDAAAGRIVDEYKAKIMAKIRSNINMPPDVAKNARAEFSVTLLPGGAVLPPRLTRPSGNAAYDNAVERAILKSDPLPLPRDAALFNRFRELKLVFKPVE